MSDIQSVTLKNKDGELGTLWEAEPGVVVFTGDLSTSHETEEEIESLVASANELNLPGDAAFTVIVELAQKYDESVGIDSIIAAGAPSSTPIDMTYELYSDEIDRVVGLTFTDEDGYVFVRSNGDWVEPNDEEWLYDYAVSFVPESAVQLFDTLVQDGNRPTLDDFDEVPVD